eukprot:6196152-Pleurochrysis_carterae.AAC.4
MTTRPDVSHAVGMMTRCLAVPTDELLKEAERVLAYLYNTRTLAIAYRSSMCDTPLRCNWASTLSPVTDGDSDASFEAGRSTSDYSFMLSDAAVAWGMKKQQSVIALSTCEAEIMAGSLAACEAVTIGTPPIGFPLSPPSFCKAMQASLTETSSPLRRSMS